MTNTAHLHRLDRCVRCLVISERHANVLQYKESKSHPKVFHQPGSLIELTFNAHASCILQRAIVIP